MTITLEPLTTAAPAETPRRRNKGKAMSPAEVDERFPSLQYLQGPSGRATTRAWVAAFNERPDAMQAILADFIKQTHAQPGRIGQRPMPKEAAVDFEGLVYGEENEKPLVEVLPALIKRLGLSDRQMSARVLMSKTTYRRMLAGEYHPDVKELRIIAAAVGKAPTFFVEYRNAMVVAAMVDMLQQRPGIAAHLYRQYLEARF